MAELVTPIMMGSAIPDWLLVAEPMQAGAPRGNFRFSIDVHVVDTPDYFVVVPMTLGVHPPLIDGSGTMLHRIYAPVKPVHVVGAQEVFFPLEVNAWHNGQPPIEPTPFRELAGGAVHNSVQRPADWSVAHNTFNRPRWWHRFLYWLTTSR